MIRLMRKIESVLFVMDVIDSLRIFMYLYILYLWECYISLLKICKMHVICENIQNIQGKILVYLKDDNYIFLGSTSIVVFLRTRICINI